MTRDFIYLCYAPSDYYHTTILPTTTISATILVRVIQFPTRGPYLVGNFVGSDLKMTEQLKMRFMVKLIIGNYRNQQLSLQHMRFFNHVLSTAF
jgi:hypothetical protein